MTFCQKCEADTVRSESGNCRQCNSLSVAKYRAAHREKVRACNKDYRTNNREKEIARHVAYNTTHPNKVKESSAKYYASNKQKLSISFAKWRTSNPEKDRARRYEWYAANTAKAKATAAAWQAANPDKRRINNQNYRARKTENGGKLSHGLAAKLIALQRGKCACGCKQPLGDNHHLDHRMPLALGGANEDWNMQLLRQRCNNQKHAKDPIDFMQQRGFLL